jgi:hypothetical protein
MARKPKIGIWSMKSDRELIQLAKTRTLQAIAISSNARRPKEGGPIRAFDQGRKGEGEMTDPLWVDNRLATPKGHLQPFTNC